MFRRRSFTVSIVGLVAVLALVSFALAPAHVGLAPKSATTAGETASVLTSGIPHSGRGSAPTMPYVSPVLQQYERTALATIKSDQIPSRYVYLPNFAPMSNPFGYVVGPGYVAAPAPMGVGDYGWTHKTAGAPVPYAVSTASVEGVLSLTQTNVLYVLDTSPQAFSAQLNTIVTNTTVWRSSNDYWTQNVVFYDANTGLLTLIDNIWNFSGFSEPASTFYSFGGTPTGSFYFDVGPTVKVAAPFTVQFWNNDSFTVCGGNLCPTVKFGYNVVGATGTSVEHGVFDTVLFNSNTAAPNPFFDNHVSGTVTVPIGLNDDAELMIGGPGGGSTVNAYGIVGSMKLLYKMGLSYVNPSATWNLGSDTGETSAGISEWYDGGGTVHLTPGPSTLAPLWNESPTSVPGELEIMGTVTPSNAWLFGNQGPVYTGSLVTIGQNASYVPVSATGAFDFGTVPGIYNITAELSDYFPAAATVVSGVGVVTLTLVEAKTPFPAIYTPLQAWSNDQIAAISTAGSGTVTSPYQLISGNQPGFVGLDPVFGQVNDFNFPVYNGMFFDGTTAYVDASNAPPFAVWFSLIPFFYLSFFSGGPLTQEFTYLPTQLFGASHITIQHSQFTGWFGNGLTGFIWAAANLVLWNSSSNLFASDSFASQGSSVFAFGGTGNVFWGNAFLDAQVQAFHYTIVAGGINEFESGDQIWNNAFTNFALETFAGNYNPYTGLLQLKNWTENWNLSSPVPAAWVTWVNGIPLSGSIVGAPFVCGNFWAYYSYGVPLPYNDAGAIFTGGDFCPYSGPIYPVTFTESGLPAGTLWNVTFHGLSWTSTTTTITFYSLNGTPAYAVGAIFGYSATPASGAVTVSGGAAGQSVVFAVLYGTVSGKVAPTTATLTINGTAVTLTSGSYSVGLKPGVYPVVATATGYLTYFNNVTVNPAATTQLNVSLVAIPTAPAPSSSSSGLTSTDWAYIGLGLVALAVAIIVAALLLRKKASPPPSSWSPPPGSTGGAPPSESSSQPPSWQESSPPPPGTAGGTPPAGGSG